MAGLSTTTAEWISGNCTATFADVDDYESAFGRVRVRLTVTGRGDFDARFALVNSRPLQVLHSWEKLPRIAYMSLPPSRVFVSFPTGEEPLIWDGLELRLGDIVFHSRGERMHQRIEGESRWALMSLSAPQLAFYSNSVIGRKMAAPPVGRALRPQRNAVMRLLRLHEKAGRIAEANDGSSTHWSQQQELVRALVVCLTADDIERNRQKRQRYADIMVRFEDVLTTHIDQHLTISELSAAIEVPERTLRVCCAEFLGMSPTRYLLLRRMNKVRSALRHADPAKESVAEIARSYQFSELGRFAVNYRRIFGERPSTTLSRVC